MRVRMRVRRRRRGGRSGGGGRTREIRQWTVKFTVYRSRPSVGVGSPRERFGGTFRVDTCCKHTWKHTDYSP